MASINATKQHWQYLFPRESYIIAQSIILN